MADFLPILRKTFKFEGGFQSFSNDTGNWCDGKLVGTNHGISAIAYKNHFGKCPTVEQMKALTKDQALTIYKKNYWDPIQGDLIKNQSVAHIFFDAFVQSGYVGLRRVKRYINTFYGREVVPVDNKHITVAQVKLINDADPKRLFEIAHKGELDNRKALADANPAKYGMFLRGWINRINQITYEGVDTIRRNPGIAILIAMFAMTIAYAIIEYNTKS